MARFSASSRMTGLPTTTLPGASLYASANQRLQVVEVGVFNTTTTAVLVSLHRFSTAGTPGAGITASKVDFPEAAAALGTAYQLHSSTAPTLVAGEIVRASLGAAIGAGAVWTFDAKPLNIEKGTANGIGFLCLTGTAQFLDFYFIWDE